MKKGCLILITVIAATSYFYYKLLSATQLSAMWWIPLLLGICAALIFANIQGVFMALSHISKSKKNQSQWKDGELVVVSGRIQAQKNPISAPISGLASTIVEYQISKTTRINKNQSSTISDYRGCLMTPCSIHSMSGQVNLVGFPILTQLGEEFYSDAESYRRIATFLTKNPTTIMPKSPLAAIAELNKVLKDDDGDVFVNYRNSGSPDLSNPAEIPDAIANQDALDENISDLDPEEQADIKSLNEHANSQDPVEKTMHFLRNNYYDLRETAIKNGADVTAIGTYNSLKRQVNIGSALSNLSHAIHLGTASKVLNGNLKKCIICFIIFSAIFATSNYFLLKEIGIDVDSAIERVKNSISSQ